MSRIYIHTNNQQIIGALISAYTLREQSDYSDNIDISLLRLEEMPQLWKREGQTYLRKGRVATWRNRDLQSFSPLRKAVPQVMGYQDKALVIDPDVFAIKDVVELLKTDMEGKSIKCRFLGSGYKNNQNRFYASSVMLLDCCKLIHWEWDEHIEQMFNHERDYGPWIGLLDEDEKNIGEIGEEWNSFDKLTADTKLLHMTERLTQPWKTGLPVDFDMTTDKKNKKSFFSIFSTKGEANNSSNKYQRHPDPRQEELFLKSLAEMLMRGHMGKKILDEAVERDFVRHDIYDVLRNYGCSSEHEIQLVGKYEEEFEINSLNEVPWETN